MITEDNYLSLLAELVAIDTVSPMSDEKKGHVTAFLGRLGFEFKGNYWVRRGASEIWAYTHIDTKPFGDELKWDSHPLALTERSQRLYGRGVSDAKFQLLNALLCFGTAINHVVDSAEECGGTFVATFLLDSGVEDLVIVDGSAENGEIYGGLRGQLDGEFIIETGRMPVHPGRISHWEVVEKLEKIRTEMKGRHFNLTRLNGGSWPRSMTLEQVTAGFDIRFEPIEADEIAAYVSGLGATLKQNYPPVSGIESRKHFQLAPFSNPLGMIKSEFRNVWVLPGGRKSNGAHQANECIGTPQIESHRRLIADFRKQLALNEARVSW